jgi:hypothetical protein
MKNVSIIVAQLMAASARTAPKAGGKDFLEIVVIQADEDLKKIAGAMEDYAPRSTNEAYCSETRPISRTPRPWCSSAWPSRIWRATTAAAAAFPPARSLSKAGG